MSLMHRVTVCASLLVLVALQAEAQTDSTISVGVDYGVDTPRSNALKRTEGFGVAFRLPRPEAWSAAWDFGSLSSEFVHGFNGPATGIGSLSVRPILGGVAYTWRGSRVEATAALTAGVSLVKLDLNDRGRDRIRRAFGPGDAKAEGSPVLALQPKLILWYDINRWFALAGTASYLRTRPEFAIVTSDATVDAFRVDADMMRLSAGVVVKVY